jgi:hypothetical protein
MLPCSLPRNNPSPTSWPVHRGGRAPHPALPRAGRQRVGPWGMPYNGSSGPPPLYSPPPRRVARGGEGGGAGPGARSHLRRHGACSQTNFPVGMLPCSFSRNTPSPAGAGLGGGGGAWGGTPSIAVVEGNCIELSPPGGRGLRKPYSRGWRLADWTTEFEDWARTTRTMAKGIGQQFAHPGAWLNWRSLVPFHWFPAWH